MSKNKRIIPTFIAHKCHNFPWRLWNSFVFHFSVVINLPMFMFFFHPAFEACWRTKALSFILISSTLWSRNMPINEFLTLLDDLPLLLVYPSEMRCNIYSVLTHSLIIKIISEWVVTVLVALLLQDWGAAVMSTKSCITTHNYLLWW